MTTMTAMMIRLAPKCAAWWWLLHAKRSGLEWLSFVRGRWRSSCQQIPTEDWNTGVWALRGTVATRKPSREQLSTTSSLSSSSSYDIIQQAACSASRVVLAGKWDSALLFHGFLVFHLFPFVVRCPIVECWWRTVEKPSARIGDLRCGVRRALEKTYLYCWVASVRTGRFVDFEATVKWGEAGLAIIWLWW